MRRLIHPSFLLMIALLTVAEAALRLWLPRDFTDSFEYGFKQTSGFEEGADGTVHLVAARSRAFHPQTLAMKRPEGVFRIFVIGDSVDYFDDMRYAPCLTNTYAWLLGEDLRNRGMNVESYNLAVAGYGPRRIQIVLRQALKYQPSLIVLKCSDGNADWEESNYERAQEFKSWHPRNWLRKSYLVQTLAILKEDNFLHRLPWSIQTANRSAPAPTNTNAPPPDVRQQERVCQTIRESVALARAGNVPVLILTQSYLRPDATGQMRLIDHGLNAFAGELCGPGVSVFSTMDAFSKQPPESLSALFVDRAHMTRAGHKIIAQALAERILADEKNR